METNSSVKVNDNKEEKMFEEEDCSVDIFAKSWVLWIDFF